MELRQLNYFEEAATLLNFTAAARSLFISQSTLSQQIKQLETELDVLLFNRLGKRIVLTEAGRLFLPYARRMLNDAENGKLMIRDLQGMEAGHLCMGVTYSLTTLLSRALVTFSTAHPKIQIEVFFSTSEDLMKRLRSNTVDFILSLEADSVDGFSETVPLFRSNLHLIVPCSSALATHQWISLHELSGIPLILPAKGFITRGKIDRIFHIHSLCPRIMIELNDVNTIIQLVTSGHAATILTLASVEDKPELCAVPIRCQDDLSTVASLFWPQGNYRKKSALAFANLLKQLTDK